MRIVIGLTGLPGAGKAEVGRVFSEVGAGDDFHVMSYSLSDEIREELRRNGAKVTRRELIKAGNKLRWEFGQGVLAQRVMIKAEKQLEETSSSQTLLIIDSIRNPVEVDTIVSRWPKEFCLVAVLASDAVRGKRLKNRGREEERELSAEDAKADREIGVDRCIEMANYEIWNDGSMDELRNSVWKVWQQNLLSSRKR